MKFHDLAVYLNKLEATSSRIEITKLLAQLFQKSDADEIDKVVYLSLGILAPSYKGIVFNLAERMMIDVLAKAYAKKKEEVKALYKKEGDIGSVAESLAQTQITDHRPPNTSVSFVYNKLKKLALDEGSGSQDRKIDQMANLLKSLDPLSCRFVARIPVGRLRLGFSDKTILDALSWMLLGDKSAKKELESAYQVIPDVGLLAARVKRSGIKNATQNISPEVGIPVLPMLAARLKSPTKMIEKMGEVVVEPKFDGLRVLIHYKKNGLIKAFTRNLNDVAHMFPEIEDVGKFIKAKEAILDSEAVGMDPEMQKIADFQVTMQRRRKHDITQTAKNIPLRFQIFDVIYKDGKSLMGLPYLKRRKILENLFKPNKLFVVDEKVVTKDPKVIIEQYKQKVSQGLEGIIVKKASAKYVPGRTGWRWVKMKEGQKAKGKLADTIDCVIMGYTQGRGKRAQFGVGQFLAGIRDGDNFKTITKVGTGLTDEQFRQLKKSLTKLQVKTKPRQYNVHKDLEPDFWVAPELVVELAADEITVSPKHAAGLALRFPRLVKFRDDKSANQVTTLKEIKKLFRLQKS